MLRRTHAIGRALFLFYALYAMTPVSMYAVGTGASLHDSKHSRSDIVWENLLFACLVGDDDAYESPSARVQTLDAQQEDVVLVRKRRAILRQRLDLKPNVETAVVLYGSLEPEAEPRAVREVAVPLLRETDGYLVLNTGLSPPLSLS